MLPRQSPQHSSSFETPWKTTRSLRLLFTILAADQQPCQITCQLASSRMNLFPAAFAPGGNCALLRTLDADNAQDSREAGGLSAVRHRFFQDRHHALFDQPFVAPTRRLANGRRPIRHASSPGRSASQSAIAERLPTSSVPRLARASARAAWLVVPASVLRPDAG